MSKTFYKFPSIEQLRQTVRSVKETAKYHERKVPTLTFRGTVKVHGTNASVVIVDGKFSHAQSRNNVITPEEDNAGFAIWASKNSEFFEDHAREIAQNGKNWVGTMVYYGEWAGQGIQKGVAVSQVPRFFYSFAVMYVPPAEELSGVPMFMDNYPSVSNGTDIVDSFDVWNAEIEIDFNQPQLTQNQLIAITNEVELECPVGKHFGVEGIGEGVVWEMIDPTETIMISTTIEDRLTFKVKGEKHSVTKVKKLAAVDIEKHNSIGEFVEYAVTDNRLKQAFREVCNDDADRKHLGAFIKWVSSDVYKEESDTLEESDLTMKDVGKLLTTRAREWFFAQEIV